VHCLKGPRQPRKHQHKSTWWVGAKEKHQVISKVDPDDSDQPLDESIIEPEEIRDALSKEKEVVP